MEGWAISSVNISVERRLMMDFWRRQSTVVEEGSSPNPRHPSSRAARVPNLRHTNIAITISMVIIEPQSAIAPGSPLLCKVFVGRREAPRAAL